MGAMMHGMINGKDRSPLSLYVMGILLLLLLSLVVAPSLALPPGGNVSNDHSQAAPAVKGAGAGHTVGAAPPATVITVRPTQLPARQNRTAIIQALEKSAAERPKIVVPASWFILVVTLLFIILGTILYLLLRRNAGSPSPVKKIQTGAFGNATVIEPIAATGPVHEPVPAPDSPAVRFPPSLEKRFLNPEFIGEGGLARVFRVQNAKTGMTVAVKVPTRFDEITGTHFTRDIVFWQGLAHPNIIRIYSSNILPVPYIEMEYAPSSLAAIPLPLPEEKAVGIILGIARGLAYAHQNGIVHRDIKPENVLLTAEGIPKITDWGLGKAIGDIRQSSVIGFSPAYAAPEQIAPHRFGKPGPATDIYQLGMLLSEMLTGTVAFRGEGMHDLNVAILEDPPVMPSWNGRQESDLKKIILRCLAKKPEDRYASVADLIRDLESVQTRFT
jgi:eukaryotic-like serine/threonine-protein kinase